MPARFLETREVALSELTRYPGNARRGNVGEIRKSIRRHGQYRAIVVRSHDGKLTVLAGNHTADALKAEGHETARCEVIDCTDDEARRIVLADNKIGEMPDPESGERYDRESLAELLAALDGDYDATGFTVYDVEKLADSLAPDFGPSGEDSQPRLDQPSPVTCPQCHHEFVPR